MAYAVRASSSAVRKTRREIWLALVCLTLTALDPLLDRSILHLRLWYAGLLIMVVSVAVAIRRNFIASRVLSGSEANRTGRTHKQLGDAINMASVEASETFLPP